MQGIVTFGDTVVIECGGIYVSFDAGQSWRVAGVGFPANPDVLSLSKFGRYVFAGLADSGIYRSSDYGYTWTSSNNGIRRYDNTWSFQDHNGNLFAGTSYGIYRSTDSGANWKACDTPMFIGQYVFAQASSDSLLLAGADYSEVLASTDEGDSWRTLDTSILDYGRINALLIRGTNILAGSSRGMFRSSDRGTTWSLVQSGLPSALSVQTLIAYGSYVLAGSPQGLYRSSDDGANWTRVQSGLPVDQDIRSLASSVRTLYAGTIYDGLYLSTDSGATWAQSDSGLRLRGFSTSAVLGTRQFFFAGGESVFRSSDDGTTWEAAGAGVSQMNALAIKGGKLLAGTGFGVFRSTDFGENWLNASSGLSTEVYALAISGNDIFAGTYRGIFLSTDDGNSWHTVNNPDLEFGDNVFTAFAVQDSDVYAGYGDTFNGGFVFRTKDAGRSWVNIDKSLDTSYISESISALFVEGNNIFAGGGGEILHSPDNGKNWMIADTGLPGDGGYFVNGFASNGANLFAGLYGDQDAGGVYVSTDTGSTWKNMSTGLPKQAHIGALAVKDSFLFAATYDQGVYRFSGMEPIHYGVAQATSAEDILQTFPNPVSGNTTIRLVTTQRGRASISIENSLGQEIATLFSGELETGEHSFSWDARRVTPGIYWCIVRTDAGTRCSAVVVTH